jgi:GTP-binding protein YchF
VVRCFEDPDVIHVAGQVDPISDIEVINTELILSDLQMAENILTRVEKQAKSKKELQGSVDVLKKALAHLDSGKALRALTLTDEEKLLLSVYPFLTNKKVLYATNVDEGALPSMENALVQRVRDFAEKEGNSVVPICAKLEEELAQLSDEEAAEFLKTLGVEETGLNRLIKSSFTMLELITYITTGEIETRAWTITRGTCAAEAAGKIHSDIEKGFIRAEVVAFDDMVACKGRARAKEMGKARSEGRDYIVKDGDVILFYHN